MSFEHHVCEYRGYEITIEQDEDTENPLRDDCGMVDIIAWHANYNFNTRGEDAQTKQGVFIDDAEEEGYLIAPLFLHEHSGLSFSITGFSDEWDSGQIGYMFMTPERIKEFSGESTLSRDELFGIMESSLVAYNNYHMGNCWRYSIAAPQDASRDAPHCCGCGCGGFLGDAFAIGGALESAKSEVDLFADTEKVQLEQLIAATGAKFSETSESIQKAEHLDSVLAGVIAMQLERYQEEINQARARLAEILNTGDAKTYNHAFTFAFSVEFAGTKKDNPSIPADILREAIISRVNELSDTEIIENLGAPLNSYDVNEHELLESKHGKEK